MGPLQLSIFVYSIILGFNWDLNQGLGFFFVFQWADQTCRFWARPTLQLRGEVRKGRGLTWVGQASFFFVST